MIEPDADPYHLLRLLISHGIVVTPVDGRPDRYTATCPFAPHPDIVDELAVEREIVAASPDAAALADQHAPGWRDRHRWRPAFQIIPLKGVFHCYGCGNHGDHGDLTQQLLARQAAG